MSFTSVTVTGTIISPQSNPVAGVLVQFTLSQAMTDGMTQIAPQTISTTTATNGTFSVALVANDDPTTTPAGTYYKVLIGEPNNTQNFNVVVPHASAPTVDLFQLIPYSSSAFVLAPSVAKLQAGTGITLSPASGQGIVTVTSTAQGGAGALLAANNLSDVANLDTARGNLHLGNYIVETPEAHGAVRDGVTDDTAAIQAAINAAVTRGQANGSNYAEVQFSAGIYQVTSAPGGHGTPTFANSQITLPLIPSGTSTPKFTLKLKGLEGGATSLVHWNQTVGQKSGAVIRTSATGTNDVTWGEASVIGGPTNIQGYGGGSGNAWSNMLVLVDGVRIVSATANPTMCGFNFEGLLEAKIISAGYFADASPAAMAGFVTTPANFTNQWVYGLKMPATNNNDLCIVDDWSAEGVWYSIVIAEHTHVRDMRSIYCGWGITLDNRVSTPHWSQIDYASVEICVNLMGLYSGSSSYKVNIGMIDGESAGPIWDGNSAIIGDIRVVANVSPGKFDWTAGGLGSWVGNWSATPTNGHNMRLTSSDTLPGVTANQPAIPASTTAFWNKSLRDASVIITGGTVTAIAVDGTTTGLTSGMVIVPTGKSITLTYTVAPTWNWILL